ncbi:CU044_5270 family protein [Spirillospora sp. NBC_00431]
MDDLDRLGTLLAKPAPSSDVVDRGRRRLERKTHGRARKRRSGRLAAGLGLAAVATATAVAVTTLTAPVPQSPPDATQLTGRQVLFAAAAVAESRPTGAGTYWHVKVIRRSQKPRPPGQHSGSPGPRGTPITFETWTRPDGRQWSTLGPAGTVSEIEGEGLLDETDVSFAQIRRLPTEPAALRTWIRDLLNRYRKNWKHPVPVTDSDVRALLIQLLYRVPAPPKVRAAAFRAIASSPNVKSLGRRDGGQGLAILEQKSRFELVVDPATSLVRSITFAYPGPGTITTTVLTAEWTNRLPKVVPSPSPRLTRPSG